MSPNLKWRGRIETALRVVGPVLDLVIAVSDRVSRVLEPADRDFVPARMPGDGDSAPRGLRSYPRRGD